MSLIEELSELIKLEKKRVVLLERIHAGLSNGSYLPSRDGHQSKQKVNFKSKIAAFEHGLKENGNAMHVGDLVRKLADDYDFHVDKQTASGMLRRYSAQGKIFRAQGGNSFGLLEWEKKEEEDRN